LHFIYNSGNENYFEEHIWTNFIKYNAHIAHDESVIILNGEENSEILSTKVIQLLSQYIDQELVELNLEFSHCPSLLKRNLQS
jgi:hypothetical protein